MNQQVHIQLYMALVTCIDECAFVGSYMIEMNASCLEILDYISLCHLVGRVEEP